MTSNSLSPFNMGDVVTFGGYEWRVLHVSAGKALMVSENITIEATHPYNNERNAVTWEQCTLRTYLNGAFFNRFADEDTARILETDVRNDNNPWFGTNGGNTTKDRIFLLSLGEVVKYFGDSGQLRKKNPNSKYFINDQYKAKRIAKHDGKASWWWLRTPGLFGGIATYVGSGGSVNVSGHRVDNDGGAVRAALLLNLVS
jgi:hypothetical protein